MDEAGGRPGGKGADHAFNFAPAAEMNDVAEIAAAPGAAARFPDRFVAEMGQKFSGLGERAAAGSVDIVTQKTPRLFL